LLNGVQNNPSSNPFNNYPAILQGCKRHGDSIFKTLRAAAVVFYRKALITKKMGSSWLSRRGKILYNVGENRGA